MPFVSIRLVCLGLLCSWFCFTLSTQNKLLVSVPIQELIQWQQRAEACSKKTGVPADNLKKIVRPPLPDDDAFKQFFFCLCHNSGVFDDDGHLVVEKLMAYKLLNGTEETAANLYKECNKITLEDEVETGFAVGACAYAQFIYIPQKN